MENITLLIVGVVLLIIGIINITGNISTIHSYNRRKVTEEDAPSTVNVSKSKRLL